MFTSVSYLKKHTPENGTDRESYLSLLVDEYLNSAANDAKCQVLANLANFAYDPINFGYIRDVGVFDIFLYVIKNESSTQLLHFATTGICNLCADPMNIEYLIEHGGLQPLEVLLKSTHSETVADVISIFMYLFNSERKVLFKDSQVIQQVQTLEASENKVVSNLATIFLQTHKEK